MRAASRLRIEINSVPCSHRQIEKKKFNCKSKPKLLKGIGRWREGAYDIDEEIAELEERIDHFVYSGKKERRHRWIKKSKPKSKI